MFFAWFLNYFCIDVCITFEQNQSIRQNEEEKATTKTQKTGTKRTLGAKNAKTKNISKLIQQSVNHSLIIQTQSKIIQTSPEIIQISIKISFECHSKIIQTHSKLSKYAKTTSPEIIQKSIKISFKCHSKVIQTHSKLTKDAKTNSTMKIKNNFKSQAAERPSSDLKATLERPPWDPPAVPERHPDGGVLLAGDARGC